MLAFFYFITDLQAARRSVLASLFFVGILLGQPAEAADESNSAPWEEITDTPIIEDVFNEDFLELNPSDQISVIDKFIAAFSENTSADTRLGIELLKLYQLTLHADYSKSDAYAKRLYETYKDAEINPELYGEFLYDVAAAHIQKQNFSDGLILIDELNQFLKQHDIPITKLQASNLQANIFVQMGDYKSANKVYGRLLNNWTAVDDYELNRNIDNITNNYGFTFHRIGEPEKAVEVLEALQNRLPPYEEASLFYKTTILFAQANIGRAHLVDENYEALAPIAEATYEKALQTDQKYAQVIGLRLLANVAFSAGDFDVAKSKLEAGIALAEEFQMGEIISFLHQDYTKVLEANGLYKEALASLRKSEVLRDNIFERQQDIKSLVLIAENENKLAAQKLETLKQEANANSIIAKRDRRMMQGALFALLMMTIGSILLMRSNVRQNKTKKQLEASTEDLRESERKAQNANLAKSAFLANMSHEIRTPMNGVLGMTELLQSSDLDTRQKRFADTIYKSGSALLTIINDILDFSKIEAGKLELDPTPFNLRESIEDVAVLLSTRAHEKNIELIVRYSPTLPNGLMGDVGRIRQIVTNLVGNAIKFTHEGHVLVNVQGSCSGNLTNLKIDIEDTGIGIKADKLSQIFEEFTQAEATTTRTFGGTGLGLTISRRLAKAMDGDVTAVSTIGEGSVFSVSLTLPKADIETEKSSTVPNFDTLRTLIVDDLEVNRDIQIEQLGLWDLEPYAVESGAAALIALEEAVDAGNPFDLVLLDYHMPGMDGAQVAKAIRESEKFSDVGIIVLSSTNAAHEIAAFKKLNIDHYLTKPARSSLLLDTIALVASGNTNLAASETIEKPNDEASLALYDAKILLAEDNEVNRLVVKSFLEPLGVDITFALNGKEALDFAKMGGFDLILMDVSMPEMDGLEATAAIRSYEESKGLAHCPIICLTAHVMTEDREISLEAGMDDYLAKPIQKALLTSKIEQWLTAAKPNSATSTKVGDTKTGA